MNLKAFLISLMVFAGVATLYAENYHKTVTVAPDKSLASQIQDNERSKITSLEIKSVDNNYTLSASDCDYLIEWCNNDSCAIIELSLPWQDVPLNGNQLAMKSVEKITYDFFSFLGEQSFNNCPNLKEVVFKGSIGHIDGGVFNNCPQLKTIRFEGPVFSTGGPQLAENCPELENIYVDGIIYNNRLGEAVNCPKLKGYDVSGIVVQSITDALPATPRSAYSSYGKLAPQVEGSLFWIDRIANARNKWHQLIGVKQSDNAIDIAEAIGHEDLAVKIDSVRNRRLKEGKDSYIELLKTSGKYGKDFRYAPASDPLLTRTREYFNLDSVAGNGDDISKIKNLLYWVHDLVPHDGSVGLPKCKFNLPDLYEYAKENQRGYNCRLMAMMLTEALLAEGIPARYLTCEPKVYDLDPDCHVITVAWSDSLGKWVWVDPSFAAYVTDENGLMLHPGEVRERLITGAPLVLNEDANWNHKSKQTKEWYLEDYMAKNLFLLSANTINQSEPEGRSDHIQGLDLTLVPEGFIYNNGIPITDAEFFWQAPR